MENPQTNSGMLNPLLTNGAIISAALIVISLIYYFAGHTTHSSQTYVGLTVFLGGIIYATIVFRDQYHSGYISYGKSLGFSVLLGLVVGIISGIFTFLFFTVIAPNALVEIQDNAIAEVERQISESGESFGEGQIDMMMNFALFFTRPFFMAILSILSYTFWGTVFGLITSAFLKKNPPLEFEDSTL